MSDIGEEMARRQDLADTREEDPTLADVWAGSTAQIEDDGVPIDETDEEFERRVRREEPAVAEMWDDVFARCDAEERISAQSDMNSHPCIVGIEYDASPEDCPCKDCDDLRWALFV